MKPSAVRDLQDLPNLSELDEEFPPVYAVVDGKKVIIDGHHRFLAAAENGVSLEVYEYKIPIDLDEIPGDISITTYDT